MSSAMRRTKQISVALENKPGRPARVCPCLADARVNVIALSIVESSKQGILHLVVNRPAVAARALSALHNAPSRRAVAL